MKVELVCSPRPVEMHEMTRDLKSAAQEITDAASIEEMTDAARHMGYCLEEWDTALAHHKKAPSSEESRG